eukprot:Hpha_TRINITY_DN1222_c0_g1::TRINITY_DN1222_c0_g1_i1::g.44805::m.44805
MSFKMAARISRGRRLFSSTTPLLGRKEEFERRLGLLTQGLQKKETGAEYWGQVYSPNCVLETAGQKAEGVEYILGTLPSFVGAFDITPVETSVMGTDQDDTFVVHYKHKAKFVGDFGMLRPNNGEGVFEGINIHTVDGEGRTTRLVQSLDLMSYFMQIGAVDNIFPAEESEEASSSAPPEDLRGAGAVKVAGVKDL